jgi:plasmid maintenance system antidote protein VapI
MGDNSSFTPDWASPPGDTIATILMERRLTSGELARRIKRTKGEVEDLLHGRAEITADIARELAGVLGATEAFWTSREAQYNKDLARLEREASLSRAREWLSEIPVEEMVNRGWLKTTTGTTDKVTACLQFFGVSTVPSWRKTYMDVLQTVAFRTSPTFASQPGAVVAWLRQGEVLASSIKCKSWDPSRFRTELVALRALTRVKDPDIFIPELKQRSAECGVAIVVLRAPKMCRASGASRFFSPKRALLMLSFRYLSDDHFWFTFFHEAGHLVLHGDRKIFLEGDGTLSSSEEEEANAFAANLLIPPEHKKEMLELPINGIQVVRFARRIGVSAGLVVGQLQHHGRIRQNQLQNLKRRFVWKEK